MGTWNVKSTENICTYIILYELTLDSVGHPVYEFSKGS